MGSGGGWEYSWSGSLHFNLYVIGCIFDGALACSIKLYSSLWMVLGGLVMLWFISRSCVYWDTTVMCLSSGFWSEAICFKINIVQFGYEDCISRWLNVSIIGLIVVINAYNIRGGGWC